MGLAFAPLNGRLAADSRLAATSGEPPSKPYKQEVAGSRPAPPIKESPATAHVRRIHCLCGEPRTGRMESCWKVEDRERRPRERDSVRAVQGARARNAPERGMASERRTPAPISKLSRFHGQRRGVDCFLEEYEEPPAMLELWDTRNQGALEEFLDE